MNEANAPSTSPNLRILICLKISPKALAPQGLKDRSTNRLNKYEYQSTKTLSWISPPAKNTGVHLQQIDRIRAPITETATERENLHPDHPSKHSLSHSHNLKFWLVFADLAGLTLQEATATNPLLTAVNRSLQEQGWMNNAGKQFMQGIARATGWFVLDTLFYGGNALQRSFRG